MIPGGLPGVGIGGVGGSLFLGGAFGDAPVSSPGNASQEEEEDDEDVRGLQSLRLEAVI